MASPAGGTGHQKPLIEVEVEERFYPHSITPVRGMTDGPPATVEMAAHFRLHITIPEATFTEERHT